MATPGIENRRPPMPEQNLKILDLPVVGMTCASCVRRVELAVAAVPGVTSASVNLAAERVHVEGGDPIAIGAAIRQASYALVDQTIDLRIAGMTCASCVSRVVSVLSNALRLRAFTSPLPAAKPRSVHA